MFGPLKQREKSWGFVYITQVTTLSVFAYNISERALDFQDEDERRPLEIKANLSLADAVKAARESLKR